MTEKKDRSNEFDEVLDLKGCAKLLKFGEQTIRNLLNSDRYDIPVHYVGSSPKFVKEEVIYWLKTQDDIPKGQIKK